jgi:hypothetical protein
MKTRRQFSVAVLALALSLTTFSFAAHRASAAGAFAQQEQYGSLERGYRTGYSDGYQAGWGDQLKRAAADYRSKADYRSADRAYIAAYGQLEEYRDGYQQGFEAGYGAGYNRQGFDSNVPAGGVTRRGATPRETAESNGSGRGGRPADAGESSSTRDRSASGDHEVGNGRVATSDTLMLVELQSRLSTDVSQRGDRFEAQVIEPQEFAGAIVSGRLSDVQRPGKAKGRALLQLDFDQIRMPGGDAQEFSAQVVEVIPSEDSGVGEIDPEGGVRGKSDTKGDVTKVGASTGIGAIIGGITGGGKGAIIGAVIGGTAGTAGVMTQRGSDIRLERGQQLRIRATNRAR